MDADQDALEALEQRILKAVQHVETLRKERDAALEELAGTKTLRKELDELKAERKQVRTRIEKLLAQVDSLG
jgi:uncharacterized coiled-coil DUF342 family protein